MVPGIAITANAKERPLISGLPAGRLAARRTRRPYP
jgi:hypothetical protein